MDNRRTEPRYLVKEDAFLWDLHHIKAGYHPASIVDVSRNGMRLESVGRLVQGSQVAIDFRGMIVCGTVQPTDALCSPGGTNSARVTDAMPRLNAGFALF
jgi:hypothetical protein